jgi:hypothetical protein
MNAQAIVVLEVVRDKYGDENHQFMGGGGISFLEN